MTTSTSVQETGLEVIDLRDDTSFAARKLNARDVFMQMEGLQRLSRSMVESPGTILQELVNAAVDLCGADSAGISIEDPEGNDHSYYRWVATAGTYSGFLNAILPRYPSACGICLERGWAQHFTVSKQFFDTLGVEAPVVTDGILLPWCTEETRGTIFVMAHTRTHAFDASDARLLKMLADFAATGFRLQSQQKQVIARERVAAAAQMANNLAHQINNPLQSMTNVAYMLAENIDVRNPELLGRALSNDIGRLSSLVRELLALKTDPGSTHAG